MKTLITLTIAVSMALSLHAQSPTTTLLHYRQMTLCADEARTCSTVQAESRVLRIVAPKDGATAYQIQVITPDRNGSRRTWEWIIPRTEQLYGEFRSKVSATFFTLPIDLDIPILDIWVSALTVAGEPDHQNFPQ